MPVLPELQIRLANSPGAFAEVCRVLADEHADIIAFSLDDRGQLRMVVGNHLRAVSVLRAHHYPVVEREVIVAHVSEGARGLAPALSMLSSAGVNVDYAYGSISRSGQPAVVLATSDPLRAAAASGL